jgi:hypothetical protein
MAFQGCLQKKYARKETRVVYMPRVRSHYISARIAFHLWTTHHIRHYPSRRKSSFPGGIKGRIAERTNLTFWSKGGERTWIPPVELHLWLISGTLHSRANIQASWSWFGRNGSAQVAIVRIGEKAWTVEFFLKMRTTSPHQSKALSHIRIAYGPGSLWITGIKESGRGKLKGSVGRVSPVRMRDQWHSGTAAG